MSWEQRDLDLREQYRRIVLGWQWSPEWAVEEAVRQINTTGEVDDWQRVLGPFVGLDAALGPRVMTR